MNFIAELRKLAGTMEMLSNGSIRQKDTGCCPIVAAAGRTNSCFNHIAMWLGQDELGLSEKVTSLVISAADNRQDVSLVGKMRRFLLETLGLNETSRLDNL